VANYRITASYGGSSSIAFAEACDVQFGKASVIGAKLTERGPK